MAMGLEDARAIGVREEGAAALPAAPRAVAREVLVGVALVAQESLPIRAKRVQASAETHATGPRLPLVLALPPAEADERLPDVVI